MGLTAVCKEIVGSKTVTEIKARYEKLRDFFEIAEPTTQCNATIPRRTAVNCWICRKALGRYMAQCEHKFPILLALLFSGLFETQLYASLPAAQRQPYIAQLQKEYDWAHQRCNMIKNNSYYVKDDTETSDIVTLTFDETTVNTDLAIIYTQEQKFQPTRAQLVALIPEGQAAWTASSRDAIRTDLTPLMTTINGAALRKSNLFASFERGVKTRVQLFLKSRGTPLPSNRFSPAARASLPRILSERPSGGRRKTRHRNRNGRHRTYRGGTNDEDNAVLVEVIGHLHDYAKEINAFVYDYRVRYELVFTSALSAMIDALSFVYDPSTALDDFDAVVSELINNDLREIAGADQRSKAEDGSRTPPPAAAASASATPQAVSMSDRVPGSLATDVGSVGSPSGSFGSPFSFRNASIVSSQSGFPSDPRALSFDPASLSLRQVSAPSTPSASDGETKGGFVLGPRPDWL
jgi:hypothetical protein